LRFQPAPAFFGGRLSRIHRYGLYLERGKPNNHHNDIVAFRGVTTVTLLGQPLAEATRRY